MRKRGFEHFQYVGPLGRGSVNGKHDHLAAAGQQKIIELQGVGGFLLVLDAHPVGKPREAGVLHVGGHAEVEVGGIHFPFDLLIQSSCHCCTDHNK